MKEIFEKLFKHKLASSESSKVVNRIYKLIEINMKLFDTNNKYYDILETVYNDNLNARNQFLVELRMFLERIETEDIKKERFFESLTEYERYLIDIINNIKSVPLLQSLITDNIGTCIIGANGVGKTTMVSDLKDNTLTNLVIIPADKPLNFKKITYPFDPEELNIDKVIGNLQLKIQGKEKYTYPYNTNEYFISNIMYNIIEHHSICLDNNCKDNSIFVKIKTIWEKLYPEIILDKRIQYKDFTFSKNGSAPYYFNSLSDGERSSLLFLMVILSIDEPRIFVIDEPESHLNIALCNELWREILKIKEGSKFIFISHQNEFVASHDNIDLIWCKEYIDNNSYNVELVEKNEVLPKELLVSLLGTKKPVLFCEGEYTSIDYRLYSLLYESEYLVKPVGGHTNVINFTEAYNNLNFNQAFGIIDRDERDIENIDFLNKKNIHVLPCNEVEILFLHKELMEFTELNNSYYTELYDLVIERKNEIILKNIKKKIERHFNTNSITEMKDTRLFKKEFVNLYSKINIDKMYNEFDKYLQQIVEDSNYSELLKICSLKNELDLKLPSKFFEDCLKNIAENKEYQKQLKLIINL